MEPVGQDGAPHRQRHNFDYVEPSWFQEGSTHESVSQRGRTHNNNKKIIYTIVTPYKDSTSFPLFKELSSKMLSF